MVNNDSVVQKLHTEETAYIRKITGLDIETLKAIKVKD
jgi:hypothetical protein